MTPAHGIHADLSPRGRHFIAVLSLDGGGIRGLIAARVLGALEQRAGMPASRLFDLIAGTSTGGIIALALTKPGPDPSRPQYSAMDLVDLYRSRGPEIFQRSLGQLVASLGGLAGPKYSAAALERVLRGYFGATRVREALTPVLVTSYDTAAAKPYFFKSYRRPAPGEPAADDLMWQAARATSAAPTYFPPFELKAVDPGAEDRSLLDGGVFANNPSMCALADASKLFGGSDLPILVASIGTGNDELRFTYGDVKSRGLLRWAVPILKVVFDGVNDSVDYETEELADEYYRFQEDLVAEELDDASPGAIERLLAAAEDLTTRRDADLAALAKALKGNVSPVSPVATPTS
jgi:predicted acylesterase/phospholipase RssA